MSGNGMAYPVGRRARRRRDLPLGGAMSDALLDGLLASLDLVVLERVDEGRFVVVGPRAAWFVALCPDAARDEPFSPGERFAFLDAFLYDAEEVWEANDGERPSGNLPNNSIDAK